MTRDTNVLKLSLLLLVAAPLFILLLVFPKIIGHFIDEGYAWLNILYSIIGIAYVAAVPYFVVLYQAFKLLKYIENGKAFSDLSVRALKIIKYCAASISVLFIGVFPLFIIFGNAKDASSMASIFLIAIGLILIFAPMVITFFAALLQKLLENAVRIKNENDLTI